MKKDITNRQDIDLLMQAFYGRLLQDSAISYIFTEVAKLNMEKHLPVIGDFWESVLFNHNVYNNNPVKIHLELNRITRLEKHHFDIWIGNFNESVDELFEGRVATMAKQRALSVATIMQIKIAQQA